MNDCEECVPLSHKNYSIDLHKTLSVAVKGDTSTIRSDSMLHNELKKYVKRCGTRDKQGRAWYLYKFSFNGKVSRFATHEGEYGAGRMRENTGELLQSFRDMQYTVCSGADTFYSKDHIYEIYEDKNRFKEVNEEIWARSGINREFEEDIPINGYIYPYPFNDGREWPKWWTLEITKLRKECIALRRKYSHYRRRVHRDEAEELQRHTAYVEARKLYYEAITNAKEKAKEKEQSGHSSNS